MSSEIQDKVEQVNNWEVEEERPDLVTENPPRLRWVVIWGSRECTVYVLNSFWSSQASLR